MAEMIPDKMPKRASAGEKRLFALLQHLPDPYLVYYESIIEDRYPDFVVICPDLGLLIIEVKGWRAGDILAVDPSTVLIKEFGKEIRHPHPVKQAKEYMISLINRCRQEDWDRYILRKDSNSKTRFIFPFGHFVLFPYIGSQHFSKEGRGILSKTFSPKRVVYKEKFDDWDKRINNPDSLIEELKKYFTPFWPIKKLTPLQQKIVRTIIHPEILIQKPTQTEHQNLSQNEDGTQLKILDLKQEQNARSIGSGHRIIYGVAGSGKTILLIARARLLYKGDPENEILILCYNLTLSSYLRAALSDCPNINIFHFDGWAKSNGITRKYGQDKETDAQLGERLLSNLHNGMAPDCRRYDVVLIDESQDFEPIWFRCVLEAMKEPEDGDLVIVGDGNQGLYSRHRIRWSELGINARGRTISAKFDLDKNYRNTRQIISLAKVFVAEQTDKADIEAHFEEDTIRSLVVDPEKCIRTGPSPVLLQAQDKHDELTQCTPILRSLLSGHWFGQSIAPLKPSDIAIFYPRLSKRMESTFRMFIDSLNQYVAPTTWLSDKSNPQARIQIADPTIKIQTIHSAKGLQYKAVYVLWADDLPSGFEDTDEQVERQLFYVALTRAEDYLIVSYSGPSTFIEAIKRTNLVARH